MFFWERKLFSESAEVQPVSLSHSAVICHSLAGWLCGRQQLLTLCSSSGQGSAQPGTPPLLLLQECKLFALKQWHICSGFCCPIHRWIQFTRHQQLAHLPEFRKTQESWLKFCFCVKHQLLVAAEFGTFPAVPISFPLFPSCRQDTVWPQLISLIVGVQELYHSIYILTCKFTVYFSGTSVPCSLYTDIWRKMVQLVQDLKTQIN